MNKDTKNSHKRLVYTSKIGESVNNISIGGSRYKKYDPSVNDTLQKNEPTTLFRVIPEPSRVTYRYDQYDKLCNLIARPPGFYCLPGVIRCENSKSIKQTSQASMFITGRSGVRWNLITFLYRGRYGKKPWFYGSDISIGQKSLVIFPDPKYKGDIKALYFKGFYPRSSSEWTRVLNKYVNDALEMPKLFKGNPGKKI